MRASVCFFTIYIFYLYLRLLTSGYFFDFSINLLYYVYMITIISCLLAYLLTIGNALSYLFYSGFVDPRFLWFSCTLAHLSGSPGSQSAPSIFISMPICRVSLLIFYIFYYHVSRSDMGHDLIHCIISCCSYGRGISTILLLLLLYNLHAEKISLSLSLSLSLPLSQ